MNYHAPESILSNSYINSAIQRIHIPFFEGFRGIGEGFRLPRSKDTGSLPKNSMVTLEVVSELDHETQSEYELVLQAKNEEKKAILIIHVHVLDVN